MQDRLPELRSYERLQRPVIRHVDIAWLAGLLEGVRSKDLAEAITGYRTAGWSHADIMKLFGVGKSTVYRHTKGRMPRRRGRWRDRP